MKNKCGNFFIIKIKRIFAVQKSRSGAVVARWAHNPKVVSSSLASATERSIQSKGCFF